MKIDKAIKEKVEKLYEETQNTTNQAKENKNSSSWSIEEALSVSSLYLKGHSFEEIGELLNGKKKQWVNFLFVRFTSTLHDDSDIKTECDKIFPKQEDIYINLKRVSPLYWRYLSRIGKNHYGYRVLNQFLATSNKTLKIPLKGYLTKRAKEHGFPITLKKEGRTAIGRISFETFLYLEDTESWIVDKGEHHIIGNAKVGFLSNYCLWQKEGNISIWYLYSSYRRDKRYLRSQKIGTVEKWIDDIEIKKKSIVNNSHRKECLLSKIEGSSLNINKVYEGTRYIKEKGKEEAIKEIEVYMKELT